MDLSSPQGFVGARGAWDKPEVWQAANEVITHTIDLFKATL